MKKSQEIENALCEKGVLSKKSTASCKKVADMEKELNTNGCIPTEEMTDFLYNRVSVERRKYIEKHLKKCDECRDFLETLKDVEKDFGDLKY